MSGNEPPPAPMRLHIVWHDLTETHVDAFTEFGQIPRDKYFLNIRARYLDDENGNQQQTDIGHNIDPCDYLYVSAKGIDQTTGGPKFLEYATYDNPITGQTRTDVIELYGYGIEVIRPAVRVNTFPANNIWEGGLTKVGVTQQILDQAFERANQSSFLAL